MSRREQHLNRLAQAKAEREQAAAQIAAQKTRELEQRREQSLSRLAQRMERHGQAMKTFGVSVVVNRYDRYDARLSPDPGSAWSSGLCDQALQNYLTKNSNPTYSYSSQDNPHGMPFGRMDGTYRWQGDVDVDNNYSVVRYDEGPQTRAWITQRDNNFVVRIARESAQKVAAEQARVAAEAERQRQAVILAQQVEAARQAAIQLAAQQEVARVAEMQRQAELQRQAAEAERQRQVAIAAAEIERQRQAAIAAEQEAARVAAEQVRISAEAQVREQARLAAEALAVEQARIVAEAQAAEQARIAAEAQDVDLLNQAYHGNISGIERALQCGARISARNTHPSVKGYTALMHAAQSGRIEAVNYFIERGADIFAEDEMIHGKTALRLAVENGHLEIAQRLMNLGADPLQKNRDGLCARDCARIVYQVYGHVNVKPVHDFFEAQAAEQARIVAEAQAAAQARKDQELFTAVKAANPEAIETAIREGANLEAIDVHYLPHQFRPVHWAAEIGRVDLFNLLVSLGANPVSINNNNHSPYAIASILHPDVALFFPKDPITIANEAQATEQARIAAEAQATEAERQRQAAIAAEQEAARVAAEQAAREQLAREQAARDLARQIRLNAITGRFATFNQSAHENTESNHTFVRSQSATSALNL